MKKTLALALMLALAVTVLTACGNETTPPPETDETDAQTQTEGTGDKAADLAEKKQAFLSVFQPVTYFGSGDDVVDVTLPDGHYVVHATGNSFTMLGYDASGKPTDLLISATNYYNGVVYDTNQNLASMEVRATGDWSFTLEPLTSLPVVSDNTPYSGSGDAVLVYTDGATTAKITGNPDESYFTVRSIGVSSGSTLVNTTEVYGGTVLLPADTVLITVDSDSSWIVEFTP